MPEAQNHRSQEQLHLPLSKPKSGPLNLAAINPKSQGKRSCEILVTPEIAEYWLGFANPRNRKPIRHHIDKMARSMKAGQWGVTTDHIGFDRTGMLANGHNRLEAVIKSGCSVLMAVDFGLEPTAVDKIDKGISRTGGHTFHMRGISNANCCHAICCSIYLWEIGQPFIKYPVNEHEALGVYESNPARISQLSLDSRRISDQCKAVPSIIGCLWYQFALISETDATEFFERLGDGVGLVQGSPILSLRSHLFHARTNKRNPDRQEQAAMIIKSWNAFRAKRPRSLVKWTRGRENFPVPV